MKVQLFMNTSVFESAGITKYQILNGLNDRDFFPTKFCTPEVQDQIAADVVIILEPILLA